MGKVRFEEKRDSQGEDVKGAIALVHYLPCKIHHDGEAEVKKRFTDRAKKMDADSKALKNSYIGRPLMGEELEIPENYEGIIMSEFRQKIETDSDAPKTLELVKSFDKMTYWNFDKRPSGMDGPVKLLDWLHISEILHKAV